MKVVDVLRWLLSFFINDPAQEEQEDEEVQYNEVQR